MQYMLFTKFQNNYELYEIVNQFAQAITSLITKS